uniref:NTF2 domain-containing protein n=1 Tax=Oncorhynchus kisutch TaxID=8019 RepID=A0A8C7GUS9_ONCKI
RDLKMELSFMCNCAAQICDISLESFGSYSYVTESIDAILSNTENTESFLKRRKVQRDFIFKYLTEDEGVVIPKNSNKDQLVKKALDVWTIEKVFLDLRPIGLRTSESALSSPHGLVLVAVAGTIHRDRECVGIYEQAFGLIRSPLDQNKWKIKFMVLKVRGQEALRVGENLLSPILTWDSNDLQLLCR